MPKGTRKKPTQEMVEAIIQSCPYEGCDHDFCAPDNLDAIREYSIKITKSFGTHDGDYWEGIIYLGDKPIIHTLNEGYGGPNNYYQLDGYDYSIVQQYKADAKSAFPRLEFEPEEALTGFLDVCFQNFNPRKAKASK